MILTYQGEAGSSISLDLSAQLGPRAEIESFEFLTPPPEFRLVRNGLPLQRWQPWADGLFDLQHPRGHFVLQVWPREGTYPAPPACHGEEESV